MRGYHVYKDGDLASVHGEILTCQCEKGNAHNPFADNVAIAVHHHFPSPLISLFAALIAVYGTSHDSRPSGMVKQLVVIAKMP